eukprot:1144663_1
MGVLIIALSIILLPSLFKDLQKAYGKYKAITNHNSYSSVFPHPLDSPLLWKRILHSVFHLWVFKLIKIGKLTFESVPNLPKHALSSTAYAKWKHTFETRKLENKSTSTLCMIYHTEKVLIWTIIILQSIIYCAFYYLLYVLFKDYLLPSLDHD